MSLIRLLNPASYTESFFALPIGVVAILSLLVGAWVVWHERARPVSVSFFAAALALGVYLFGFSWMVRADSYEVALFWGKVAYVGVPFIVPAVYQFSMDLLGLRQKRRGLIQVAWTVGGLYALAAVATDYVVAGVFRMEWGYITRITGWTYLVIGWSTFIFFAMIRDYWRAYQKADAVQRARIRLFAIPIAIASFGFIDYAPSLGLPGAPWGFVVFALFLVAAARAVSRYHLPDLTPAFAADQIVESMNEPLLVCDDEGRVAISNPAAARLLGWSVGDMKGRLLAEVFGLRSVALLLEQVGPRAPVEMEVMDKAGTSIAVSVSTTDLFGRDGRKAGTIVVARDVRERRRAAREIERREQRFRALTENALDMITILGGDGKVLYESPAVAELLGYGPEALVGRDLREVVHPDSLEALQRVFAELIASPENRVEGEGRLRHADGHYLIIEYRATNLLEHPAVRGVVINGRDVTEERRLASELQQAQKMEAIGRLAGGVAHDFNNILTAIQGNVAIVQEQADPAERFAAELEEIRRGADRAGRLTDQLLSFSRRQVVQPRVLDLNQVVGEMQDMLTRLIDESIEFRTVLADEAYPVRADRGQLEQVMLNLVVNARDAVGGSGSIEVRTAAVDVPEAAAPSSDFQIDAGRYMTLVVSDDGAGMDEETRARIFEPFFTTKEPGRGTGLGLSTVYGAVRQAGGHIEVLSSEGEGTTFRVYLPAEEEPDTAVTDQDGRSDAVAGDGRHDGGPPSASAPAGPRASEPATPAPDAPSPAGEVVLVVEDEAPVRSLMARVLKRRGYEVIEAEDGAAALEVVRQYEGSIDLVVTDLVMPGINGREVAERIREIQGGAAVIFISGYTADDVVRQGIVAGQHEFLPKPFTPDVLVSRVADMLGRHRRAPRARETGAAGADQAVTA